MGAGNGGSDVNRFTSLPPFWHGFWPPPGRSKCIVFLMFYKVLWHPGGSRAARKTFRINVYLQGFGTVSSVWVHMYLSIPELPLLQGEGLDSRKKIGNCPGMIAINVCRARPCGGAARTRRVVGGIQDTYPPPPCVSKTGDFNTSNI